MVDRFVDNPAPRNESPSFAGTVGREWRQGFLPQAAFHLADSLAPAEDGYRVTPEETKGFEQYSDWFVDSSSRAQTEAIKARIRSNEDEQAYIGRHGGFWSGLAAGALDPVNYAIPMLGEGTGLLRGALLSSITNAAGAGIQTWATSKVSPTASMDDAFANMLYAGVFAGVLGGYLGNKGQAAAHELGTHYARQSQALDARVGGVSMEHTAPDAVAPHGAVNAAAEFPTLNETWAAKEKELGRPMTRAEKQAVGNEWITAETAHRKAGEAQASQGGPGVSQESGGAAVDAGASASNVIQFPNAHEPGMPVATAMHPLGEGGAVMGNLALKLEEDLAPAAKADLHVVEGGAEKGAASGETPGEGGGKGKGGGKGGGGDEPPEEPGGPLPNAGGRFKVEPTGAGGYGLAPAYGIEKLFAKLTLGTSVISRGVKAAGDIIQRMVGEGSVLTTDNLKGIASPNSVALASKQWVAFAQDAETAIKNIWGQMRGQGSAGTTSTGMLQMADAARGLLRSSNPGGLPRLGEFKEMLFRARVARDPNAYLATLDPAVRPFLQRALPALDQFYDRMGREAVDAGVLPSPEFARRKAQADRARYNQRKGRVDELMAKDGPLTPNEEAELHVLMGAQADLMDRLSRAEFRSMATDKELADKIDEIQWKGEARTQAARDFREKLQAQLVTLYETQQKIMETLQARKDAGQPLSEAQQAYLEDLKGKYGDGAQPSAPRDAIDAYRLTQPIEPFTTRDPKFNPPANDHGVIVDKWEDRQGSLAPNNAEKIAAWFEDRNMPEAAERLRNEATGHGDFEWIGEAGQNELEKATLAHLDTIAGAAKKEARRYFKGEVDGDLLPAELREHIDHLKEAHAEAADDLNAHYMQAHDLKANYRDGVPTVFDFFHGSPVDWIWNEKTQTFEHFDNAKLGQNTGANSAKLAHFGARDPRTAQAPDYINPKNALEAQSHRPNVIMGRGRMENPKVIDYRGQGYEEQMFSSDIAAAKAAGHDGVILMNAFDGGPQDVIYAMFDSDQIRYRFDPGVKKVEAATGVSIERKPSRPTPANDALSPEQKAQAAATQKQRELIAAIHDKAELTGLTAAQEAYIHDMLDQIEGGKVTMPEPKKGEKYINVVWNHDAVHQNPEKLKAIFEQHYREQGGADPKQQAANSVAAILSHDPSTQIFDPSEKTPSLRPSPSQRRAFDIPTERVVDFLQTDTGHLMHDYARAFGAGIESSKAFGGDPFARDDLHDVLAQAARELPGRTAQQIIDQVESLGHQLTFARDAMLGRQRTGTPLTMDGVAARFLKNFASTTSLGGVGLSALTEAARPLMTRGVMDTIGATFDIFSNRSLPELQKMSAQFRMIMGEFGEVAHGMSGSRVMEMGGVTSRLGSPTAMAIDRRLAPFNELAEKQFYVANGLAHVTDFLKNWTSLLSAHFMIDDIRAVAEGAASSKTVANLAGYGIEREHAQRMLATDAFSKYGAGGNLVDMAKFNDPELVAKFSQAVQMEVRRTINTPGVFDKSMIQQGFYVGADGQRREMALATLPFQFMSWGIAANNKMVMSALQGRDASAFMGIAALTGMAYFVNWIKSGGTSGWQNMTFADKLALAVEQSGMLGSFDNLNNLIETGSQGTFGVRPALGMQPKWGVQQDGADALGVIGGPVGSKAMDVYKAFDPMATQDERASTIRRAIPFNGLPYFKGVFKGAQDVLTSF